ncbi:MAG: hypothetical protein M3Y33_05785 [Actinomycetota bacterium]|nr:hypothetical protein [Actinomycetota bacterium]
MTVPQPERPRAAAAHRRPRRVPEISRRALRPLRSLHFGPDAEGLVTFLVCEPDELVPVTRIQRLGD